MVPVFTRYLEPPDYGTLEVLVACADLGSIVLGLGLGDVLFRFVGATTTDVEKEAHAARLSGLAVICASVALVLTQALTPFLVPLLPAPVTEIQLRLLSVTLAVTACIQLPLAWLRVRDQAQRFLLFSLGKTLVQALLVLLALSSGLGVTGILLAGTTTDCMLCSVLLVQQYRATGIDLRLCYRRDYLRYGWPLILSGTAAFALGSLDRWFLADAIGVAEMAQYALAAKFGLATALLLKPFEMWWFPRRIALLASPGGQEASVRWVCAGIVLAAIVSCTVALTGPPLLRLLAAPDYHAAASWIPWLSLIAGLYSVSNLLTVGCYVGRTTYQAMLVNVLSAVAATVAYALLIPRFGIAGALYATVSAHLIRMMLFHSCSQRHVRLSYPYSRLLLLVLCAGAALTLPQRLAPGLSQYLFGGAMLGALLGTSLWLGLLPTGQSPSRRSLQNA